MLGRFEVDDPVIEELIRSKAVQRLRHIAQQGVPAEFLDRPMPAYSRYEHSVGCMLLLRHFGASLEEQVSGLLHDISHTAFSHVVDWIMENSKNEDIQDRTHMDYFKRGEIRDILKRYGFNQEVIGDPRRFTLLEREIPDLCVDRLESDLRYYHYMGRGGLINGTLESLLVRKGELVFKSAYAALRFSRSYLMWQPEGRGWGNMGYKLTAKYYFLAGVLKDAIGIGAIRTDDLKMTDSYVLDKIRRSKSTELNNSLDMLHKISYKQVRRGGILIKEKFRYVDPKCKVGRSVKRLSGIKSSYRNALNTAKEKNKVGVRLLIV